MKKYFILILFAFTVKHTLAQPVINSFSPGHGPIGTTVFISGNNFDPAPANNIVFFGGIKANVTAATNTTLTVKVPFGTTHQPITVSSFGLTAYSRRPFQVTFHNGGKILSGSFKSKQDIGPFGNTSPTELEMVDIDLDDRIDIAQAGDIVSVLRNLTSGGNLSFASIVNIAPATDYYSAGISYGDLNGDGKQDLATTNSDNNTISVYINRSSPGNISFDTVIHYATQTAPHKLSIRDLDKDGKPDIVVTNNLSNSISVFKNTSAGNSVSFDNAIHFQTNNKPYEISIADLNGDDKPEIIVTNGWENNISVFKNSSGNGVISYEPKIDILIHATSTSGGVSTGDVDGDDKTDLIVTSSTTLTVFRNISTLSSISFEPYREYASSNNQTRIAAGDLNGDGKVDFALTSQGNGPSLITVFQNLSSPGLINVDSLITLNAADIPFEISIADLNNDSLPDIVSSNDESRNISIIENKIKGVGIGSFYPKMGGSGTVITITGAHFTNVDNVKTGGIPATSFTVTSENSITATIGSADATGIVTVHAGNDSSSSADAFTWLPKPTITSFTPTSAHSGQQVMIGGTFLRLATSVTFGGVPGLLGEVDANYAVVNVGNGATGFVRVTTPGGTDSIAGFSFIPPPNIISFSPASAKYGDTVTISGNHLGGAFMITFGDVAPLSYTVLSTNTISAVVGLGAAGSVNVTTAAGSDSRPGFTYLFPPLISSFSPTVGATGSVITLIGAHFTGTHTVNFGSMPAANFTVVSDSVISATTGIGSSGYITVTTNVGTTSIGGFIYLPPKPTVTSFAPSSGPVGTVVTITGSNFSPDLLGNAVFFGTAKSDILSATATAITAIVPAGATYKPITVTANAATAYSAKPFGITFENGSLNPTTFLSVFEPEMFNGGTDDVQMADLDKDGKSDIVVTNTFWSKVSVFRNTSSGGTVSFAPRLDFSSGNYSKALDIIDYNGDGKLDVVVTNGSGNVVAVLKNLSSPGNIQLSGPYEFFIPSDAHQIATGDIDRDGRPDMVISSANTFSATVYLNSSSNGVMSTGSPLIISTGSVYPFPESVRLNDLNGDDLPELIITNSFGNTFSIHENNSIPGHASFRTRRDYQLGYLARTLSIGDLDGDDKPDLVLGTYIDSLGLGIYSDSLTILKNTSSGTSLSFSAPAKFRIRSAAQSTGISDLDGDGKPDIYLNNIGIEKVTVLKNTTANAIINFAPFVEYPIGIGPDVHRIYAGDLTGDGQSEIACTSDGYLSVLLNQNPLVKEICPGSSTALVANITGSTFTWQVNTGSGFVNIANNAYYSGTLTNTLQLNAVPSAWYGYKYRCMINGNIVGKETTIRFSNSWTGNISNAWENALNWSCGVVPDLGTDVVINSGTILMSTNETMRSLNIAPGVNFTVASGNMLVVTGGSSAIGSLGGSPGGCTPFIINGIYTQELPLSGSNNIQIQVNVAATGPYLISTNTVNGISFSKAGTFVNIGIQNIILEGNGNPEYSGSHNFVVNFGSGGCTFSINFSPSPPSYMPTTVNSNWTYAVTSTADPADSLYKVSTPNFLQHNGELFRKFQERSELSLDYHTGQRRNGSNYYFYYDHFDYTRSFLFLQATGQIKQLDDSAPVGAAWNSDITGWVNNNSQNTPIRVQGSIVEKGISVSLATGLYFSNVIKVKLNFYDMSVPGSPLFVYADERWFAPGVGLIYYQLSDPLNGGATYQLKRYHIY